MGRTVKVEGLPQMTAALARKAAEAHAAAVAAVAAEVEAVKADASSGAPVDKGELRDSIRGEASGTSGTVRATARHANFVESGTFKDKAQPFMGPAAEASRSRFPGGAATTIRTALSRR